MSRQRLIDAARHVFAKKGYAEASLREIAEAVGIKTPSIYAHFEGKQSLFESVYAEITAEHVSYFTHLAQDSRAMEPLERIRHLLVGVDAFYDERPDAAEFSLRAAVEEQSSELPSLRQIFLDFESSLADAFRSAYREGLQTGAIRGPEDEAGFLALVLMLMDGLFLQRAHYSAALYAQRFEAAWQHLVSLMTEREN